MIACDIAYLAQWAMLVVGFLLGLDQGPLPLNRPARAVCGLVIFLALVAPLALAKG